MKKHDPCLRFLARWFLDHPEKMEIEDEDLVENYLAIAEKFYDSDEKQMAFLGYLFHTDKGIGRFEAIMKQEVRKRRKKQRKAQKLKTLYGIDYIPGNVRG